MSVTEPALAVAQVLAAGGLGLTLGNGGNLFASGLLPAEPAAGIPHACVFCIASGGAPARPYFVGPAGAKTSTWYPSVQVLVRGNVDGDDTARSLASAIRKALHRATVSGYISCLVRESTATELGLDPTQHPLFSLNVELWYTE